MTNRQDDRDNVEISTWGYHVGLARDEYAALTPHERAEIRRGMRGTKKQVDGWREEFERLRAELGGVEAARQFFRLTGESGKVKKALYEASIKAEAEKKRLHRDAGGDFCAVCQAVIQDDDQYCNTCASPIRRPE